MISLPPPSRPRRSLLEALRCLSVASLVDRTDHLAALRAQAPRLFTQPVRRIYQLPYLDAAHQSLFRAGFAAGRPTSLRLLGKLAYETADWWAEPAGELVPVYWLPGALGRRYGVVVLIGRDACWVLPVPGCLFLGLWLVPEKRILW